MEEDDEEEDEEQDKYVVEREATSPVSEMLNNLHMVKLMSKLSKLL
jgi:hypothetical protein